MEIGTKPLAAAIIVVSFLVGFFKGYDSGFTEGMKTGEMRELINQGFTVEDAEYIVENREQMMTTSKELFEDN